MILNSQHGWSPRELSIVTPLRNINIPPVLIKKNIQSNKKCYSTTKNHAKKRQLYLETFNARTLLSKDRLVELDEALTEIKWDVIGLAEIRRPSEQLFIKENGNLFYHYGKTKGQMGVGFYVHKRWRHKIQEVKAISERIAILKLQQTNNSTLIIIQAYAPTSAASDEEILNFCTLLDETYEKNQSKANFVIGDFNCKVGQRNRGEERIIGNFFYGTRSKHGENLVHFAQHQLKIANTYFKKPSSHQ